MQVRTVVVEGPLALRMRRLQAAREGTVGLQVLGRASDLYSVLS